MYVSSKFTVLPGCLPFGKCPRKERAQHRIELKRHYATYHYFYSRNVQFRKSLHIRNLEISDNASSHWLVIHPYLTDQVAFSYKIWHRLVIYIESIDTGSTQTRRSAINGSLTQTSVIFLSSTLVALTVFLLAVMFILQFKSCSETTTRSFGKGSKIHRYLW